MEKETILGIDVCVTDYDQLSISLSEALKTKTKSFLVAINPEKIMKAQKDTELKQLLNSATYQIADGVGVVYASKICKGQVKHRVTGIDCMDMICGLANEGHYKIFLYGARQEILELAVEELKRKFPNIDIVGAINGFEDNEKKVIDTINTSKADIIFVAMGSPRQELWIQRNFNKIGVTLFQGVGGSFDVLSGRVKRAPVWMQKFGLEWLYRLLKDPTRIKRQIALLSFFGIVLKNYS